MDSAGQNSFSGCEIVAPPRRAGRAVGFAIFPMRAILPPFSPVNTVFSTQLLDMVTRRAFLRTTGAAGGAAIAAFTNHAGARVNAAASLAEGRSAAELATDE